MLCPPPPVFNTPEKNINVYELWPVVAGIHRWAPSYRNSCLHIVTDNMQVLAMINTGRSINKTCMSWLREIFWTCFVHNMDIFTTYIKSSDNVLADALSLTAYPGIPSKCPSLLTEFNMCCSSPSSSVPSLPEITPTTPTGCLTRGLEQEVTPLPDELLF